MLSIALALLCGLGAPQAPSYPLSFLEHAAEEPARWEARLLEKDSAGRVTAWSWRVLVKGDADPLLVYDIVEFSPVAETEAFVEVRQRQGDWVARAPVPATTGEHAQAIELELVQLSVLGGGVVDELDQPMINTELRLYQVSGTGIEPIHTHPHLAWTEPNGEFRFAGVEPGHYHLRVQCEGRRPVMLEVELASGAAEGYELRMKTVEATGQLPVAIVGVRDDLPPAALLALRSLDGQHVARLAHTRGQGNSLAQIMPVGVGFAALFAALPAGRYELSVLGLDSFAYDPPVSVLDFDALGEGLRLQAQAPGKLHSLRFSVSAEDRSGPLAGCYLRFSSRAWWSSRAMRLDPTDAAATLSARMPTPDWMVGHVGYLPVHGTFAPGAQDDEGTHERLRLKPGWGCELLFRDGSERLPQPDFDSWMRTGAVYLAKPVEQVVVFADGVEVGRSNVHGRVRLTLPGPPARLTFKKTNWIELPAFLTGFVDAHDVRTLEREGSTVVWLERK